MPILNGVDTAKLYNKLQRPNTRFTANELAVLDQYLSHISFDDAPVQATPVPEAVTQVVQAPSEPETAAQLAIPASSETNRLQMSFGKLSFGRLRLRSRANRVADAGPSAPPLEASPSEDTPSEVREPEGNAFIAQYFGASWTPKTAWERTDLIARIEDKILGAGDTALAIAAKARTTLLSLTKDQISKASSPTIAQEIMSAINPAQDLWFDDIDLKHTRTQIGEGSNGSVAKYTISDRRPRAGHLLAVKTAHDDTLSREELFYEILAMIALRGTPNVMEFDGLFIGRELGFVSMFMNYASLHDLLESQIPLLTYAYTRLDIAVQIVNGINAMHKAGWFHGDIKPANILVSVVRGKIVVKIADLATARKMNGTQYTIEVGGVCTTWVYCDPHEMAKDINCRENKANAIFNYGPPQDTYSLAYVLYFVLNSQVHTLIEEISNNDSNIARLKKELEADPDNETIQKDIALFEGFETERKFYLDNWKKYRERDQMMMDRVQPPIPSLNQAITMCWGRTAEERQSLDTVLKVLRQGLREAPEPPTTLIKSVTFGDISELGKINNRVPLAPPHATNAPK